MGKGFPKHLLNAIALVAMLFLISAARLSRADGVAHSEGQSATGTNKSGPTESMWDPVSNTWRILRSDGNGNHLVSVVPSTYVGNFGVAGATLPYLTMTKGTPVGVSPYAQYELHVSYAAADTDSIGLQIIVVGKETSNGADGLDMPFSSDLSDSSGVPGWYLTGSLPVGYNGTFPSGIVLRNTIGGTYISAVKGKLGVTKTTGWVIPIVSKQGAVPRFLWLNVWLINRARSHDLSGVTIDLYTRNN